MKVSEERLRELAFSAGLEPCDSDPVYDGLMVGEVVAMAKELLALRKAFSEPAAYEVKGLLCHTLEEAEIYVGEPEPLYRKP